MSAISSSRGRSATATIMLTAALAAGAAGCLERVVEPAADDVAGFYQAEGPLGVMKVDSADITTDWLARGGSVKLFLNDDGTAEGTMRVPDLDGPGLDGEYDLAGSWSLDGDAVTLDTGAPAWLEAMVFRFIDGTLTAGARVGEDGAERRIRLTLVQL